MGRIILVTGGARGIGAATCRLAARLGYDVAVNYASRADAAEKVVADVKSAGRRAIAVKGDVSKEADVKAMFAAVDKGLGRLDVLVNNAGTTYGVTRFEETPPGRFEEVMAINVLGVVYCTREAIRRMARRHGGNGGAILNISSISAKMGGPNDNVEYSTSKAAIEAMANGLAKQIAPEGIRLNTVRPGLTHSDIHAKIGDPDRATKLGASVPLGQRAANPEEIAEAILWLASDKASYCTGAVLDVHGGRSL